MRPAHERVNAPPFGKISNRQLSEKTLIFFIFPLDFSADWLYSQIISRKKRLHICTPYHSIVDMKI